MQGLEGSTGRFTQKRERSGPMDGTQAETLHSTSWRTCGECSYRTTLPKPFRAMHVYANFQPIGGTFSYRF
jgi:hypothetical protein